MPNYNGQITIIPKAESGSFWGGIPEYLTIFYGDLGPD